MRLLIGFRDYDVRTFTVADTQWRPDSLGFLSTEHAALVICGSLSPREQARVLIHEVLHACFDATGLDCEGDAEDLKMTQESVCVRLDRTLTQVFLANPHLSAVLHQAIHHDLPIVQS